jgi:hypothetical protein
MTGALRIATLFVRAEAAENKRVLKLFGRSLMPIPELSPVYIQQLMI